MQCSTVDGSEIRRSPVEVGSLSMLIPLFTGVLKLAPSLSNGGFSHSHRISGCHQFPVTEVSGDDEWMEPGSPKVDGSGKGLRVAIIDFDHADPVEKGEKKRDLRRDF